MRDLSKRPGRLLGVLALGLGLGLSWSGAQAEHDIPGIDESDGTGNTAAFGLYAYPFNMPLPEGTSLYMWGFGDMTGSQVDANGNQYYLPQYPAPTLIVDQGDTVTINMTNYGVPQPVSIVVTGHEVSASGGAAGLVTQAATIGQTVAYSFTAENPGTYVYHSLDGPNPGLHAEMGLQGVLIVRPSGFDAATNRTAYGAGGTEYEQEFLYLLTEVDPEVHLQMERGHYNHFTNSDRFASVWFVNGRVFPDLFQGDFNPLYPNQPYQSLALAHPADRVLVRNVNAGHDSHPFHYHGENLTFIAQDGGVLSSDPEAPSPIADLGRSDNTINSAPKQAIDAIWKWTGKGLNWDIYGTPPEVAADHTCNGISVVACLGDGDPADCGSAGFDPVTQEYCPDHGKALPVTLPGVGEMTLGAWYSGSPYLGDLGDLPPGEGGLNPFGGYFFVWHSHAEKELTTFDIFPGGSLSAVVVLPPYIPID